MPRPALILFFLFLLNGTTLPAQEKFTVKKDLKSEWLSYDGNQFKKIEDGGTEGRHGIHFVVDSKMSRDEHLLIKSRRPFFLFLNGKLLREGSGALILPLDSLSRHSTTAYLTFSFYQRMLNEQDVVTQLVSRSSEKSADTDSKPSSFFRDFVSMAGLILITFFVIMIRVQPKLSADYFSIQRILSLREGEDNQSHARFALSSNLWFYVFCSLLLGLFLMILFYHLPEKYVVTRNFRATEFFVVCWQWIKLSFLILVILMVKIMMIFALSNLFGMKGIAGVHFFNVVRLLLIVTSSLIVIVFIYFVSRGHDPTVYTAMLSILIFILAMWIGLVFLKLNNRIEHSMFHLFSYICATEVIPLLITVKVLFQ
jgi:hypothetical protein